MRQALRSLVVVVLAVVVTDSVIAQSERNEFNRLFYFFPASHAVGALINDGTGELTWAVNELPATLVALSINGTCPEGWTEYTAARGRYLVGLPAGGTLEGTVGTALANNENRGVREHTHTATLNATLIDNGHSHAVIDPGHLHGSAPTLGGLATGDGSGLMVYDTTLVATGSALTGVGIQAAAPGLTTATTTSINAAPFAAGTNAPYIQVTVCEKS